MTIIEAIKSGKAFRRRGYQGWIGPFTIEDMDIGSETEPMLQIFVGDILADDWEVREE